MPDSGDSEEEEARVGEDGQGCIEEEEAMVGGRSAWWKQSEATAEVDGAEAARQTWPRERQGR